MDKMIETTSNDSYYTTTIKESYWKQIILVETAYRPSFGQKFNAVEGGGGGGLKH